MTWKAYLLHLTHYDPVWLKTKATEKRFDRKTAEACIRAAAAAGFNMLLVDVKDAVVYRRLPHLKKPYSVPLRELRELASLARGLGLEVVPKLNFSKSPQHRHSHWLWPEQASPDSPALWRDAFAAIDEVVAAVRPRLLHVGMDEDDTRSPDEYRRALLLLHRALKRRGLRMMMWADCGHRWRPAERWKVLPAIRALPRDVILMPWDYHAGREDWLRRFRRMGFAVLGTASCRRPREPQPDHDLTKNVRDWIAAVGKTRAQGVAVTHWSPCCRANRAALLEGLEASGRLLAGCSCAVSQFPAQDGGRAAVPSRALHVTP